MEGFGRKVEEQEFSVLQGEGAYFRKIVSRVPSTGASSDCSQYSLIGNVPFDWEVQPGKPKTSPSNGGSTPAVGPLPPPSERLMPKPRVLELAQSSSSRWSRFKLWRMVKKHGIHSEILRRRSAGGPTCLPHHYRATRLPDAGLGSSTHFGDSSWSSNSLGPSSSSSSSCDSCMPSPATKKLHTFAKHLIKWRF